MVEEVEISSLDLRFEKCRMKNAGLEKSLIHSILEKGIRDPLQGIDPGPELRILLNGFKRLRCAKKLGLSIVPYCTIGNDEVMGIIELLRISNAKSLTILEQAKLIDELKTTHKMGIAEIARHLERSKSWVSMRAGMIKEMPAVVQNQIFSGKFPVYSYMYTLRPFIRTNGIKKEEIGEFVESVSGNNLSIRDINTLSHAYFKGSDEVRQQIKEGNVSWMLNQLHERESRAVDCSEFEQKMLRDFEIVQKYMQRVIFQSQDERLKSNSFFAQANIVAGGILSKFGQFQKSMRAFYDKSRQA